MLKAVASRGALIITGASRGIGAATAQLAATDGWDVAINYAGNQDAAEEVAAAVRAIGQQALVVQGDMADEGDIHALFQAVERDLGPLRGLVNNAGITGQIKRVDEMTSADIDPVFDLNVKGLLLCCGEAVRRMSTTFQTPCCETLT